MFTVVRLAIRAYARIAAEHNAGGIAYAGEERLGVPHVVVFIGTGREAWRISQRAIEEWKRPA